MKIKRSFIRVLGFIFALTAALFGQWSQSPQKAMYLQLTFAQPTYAQVSEIQAKEFVEMASQELISLVTSNESNAEKQEKLLVLLDKYAVLEQIAKFVIGIDWRNMTHEQKDRYKEAFKRFVAGTYVVRFNEYSGETIRVTRSLDAGRKGQLVQTQIQRADNGGTPINIEWLVSDRSGAVKIEDLRVEGVSLAITQREEFSAMLAARQNDYDLFIADLMAKAKL